MALHARMQSSLSSSASASSCTVSCPSLKGQISWMSSPESMGPRLEIILDKQGESYPSIASEDGATSTHLMRKSPSTSSLHGELDCSHESLIVKHSNRIADKQAGDRDLCKQASVSDSKSNSSASSPLCHSNSDNRNDIMFEASPKPENHFKSSAISIPNPKCEEHPGRELLEEGEGECYGDQHVSSFSGSPSVGAYSEDSIQQSWRRLSPTAASCFCKDIEEEQEYFQQVLGSSSHGWTDEKHSCYLDSMEADFLRSVMFKGRVLHTDPPSDLDDSASSHQAKAAATEFKVCQSGRWRPVYVQAPYVRIGSLKQLAVAVRNPWIKRFRASRRGNFPSMVMENPLLEEVNVRRDSRHLQ